MVVRTRIFSILTFFLLVFSLAGCSGSSSGGQNQSPIAADISLSTAENTPLSATLSGSEVNGVIASYKVVAQPNHGTLSGTVPSLTYTPDTNFVGTDTFAYTVTDDKGQVSAQGTVTITVSSAGTGSGGTGGTVSNQVPTAMAQSVSTNQDTSTAITLAGSDSDGSIASYAIASSPTHGSLSGTAPNVTYTPASGYTGNDSFTFTVTDNGGATSTAATVSITVNAVTANSPPTATAQSVSTVHDTSTAITLAGTDSDGTISSYTIVSQPSNGSLSGTPPNLTYLPNSGYSGSDSFTFTVTDNGGASSTAATVSITVSANAPPTATAQSVTTAEDTAKAITVAGTDSDGTIASYAIVSGPSNGTLSGTAPNYTYTPNANYNGSDSFTFTVTDNGGATSTAATVSITITAVDDAPVANTDNYTATGNTQKSFSASLGVLANDTDIDTPHANLTVTSTGTITTTGGGSVSMNADGSFTYTPPAGATSDSFQYTISDNDTTTPGPLSATGTVNITMNSMVWYVNDSFTGTPTGTSVAPFTTLAAAANAESAGDTIFVYAGNSATTPYTGGITLLAGSSLIGEGSGLSVDGLTVAAGTKPVITASKPSSISGNACTSGTNVITLANGNTIKGVTITAGDCGIYSNTINSVTMDNISVQEYAESGIYLQEAVGTINLQNSSVTNTTSTFHGFGFILSNITSATNAIVNLQNTSFNGSGNTTAGMYYGADVYTDTGSQTTSITKCIFNNIMGTGIEDHVWGTAGGDSVTIGNTSGGSGNGNTFTGVAGKAMNLTAQNNTSSSFTVRGNSIDGNGLSGNSGIHFAIESNGATSKVDISNNTISNINTLGASTLSTATSEINDKCGICVWENTTTSGTVNSMVNVTITGNTISNTHGRGIHVDNYVNVIFGVRVDNNTVTGSSQDSTNLVPEGIAVFSDAGAQTCLEASGNSSSGTTPDYIFLYNGNNSSPVINLNGASDTTALAANNSMQVQVSAVATSTAITANPCSLTPVP